MGGRHDSSLVFGMAGDRLVHISEVERGLLCECACPLCHEPLVAKKGEERSHHFSHTSDTTCAPNPETLTHRFAKEFIARELRAPLPAFEARVQYENYAGHTGEAWGREPSSIFEADAADVEYQGFGDFVPDVLLRKAHLQLVVEVHFRHPVPEEKVELIQRRYLPAVEVNLSDLPTDCAPGRVAEACRQPWRWKWLNNRSYVEGDIHKQLVASHSLYFPKFQYLPTLRCATPQLPLRKLEAAEAQLPAAEAWIQRSQQLPPAARQPAYLGAPLDLRLAIHCAHLGIRPLRLPLNLMQKTHGQSIVKEHAMYWQTWVFSKFCVGQRQFNAHEVTHAARGVFRSINTLCRTIQSDNGFSEATVLFYEFLLQLVQQELLTRIDGDRSWQHEFKPVVQTRADVVSLLCR